MRSLHEVIYHLVQTSTGNVPAPQLIQGFNLSAAEVKALETLFSDENKFQNFLSPESLKKATKNAVENIWVPPQGPA